MAGGQQPWEGALSAWRVAGSTVRFSPSRYRGTLSGHVHAPRELREPKVHRRSPVGVAADDGLNLASSDIGPPSLCLCVSCPVPPPSSIDPVSPVQMAPEEKRRQDSAAKAVSDGACLIAR